MKNKIILVIFLFVFILSIIGYQILKKAGNSSEDISKASAIDTSINTDDGDEEIDWSKYETKEIHLSNSLTITKEGVYVLTGSITNGFITINTSGNVKLILNNVTITNSSGPAIYVENAKNTIISLVSNSINTLTDGSNYSGFDTDVDGAIYSKDDLIFEGEGTLNIIANYQDGIVSKDDLKIIAGTYNIESVDDGIRGKDSVYILGGTFTITAGGDGIKATNDTDTEKGFSLIENGNFIITAELDGIQAETKLVIQNGVFTIETGGGSSNSSSSSSSWGMWGNTSTTDSISAKGLKANDNLVIENGTFTLNTSDDAIHSNNYVGIVNGNFEISSGDDGIHADETLVMDNGTIHITKSYEGIEGSNIIINDGIINLTSSDDGMNAAGGNDASSMNRPGQNNFSSSSSNKITINGGTIYINASGDGIDANGSVYIYGGYITVDGPTNSGNGALDYDKEFAIYGGTLLAVGTSGMAQGISSTSTQYGALINLSNNYNAKKIVIIDAKGNEVISYTPTKSYSSIVVSVPEFEKGSTYTLEIDESLITTFTLSSTSITVGNSMGGNGGPIGKGR